MLGACAGSGTCSPAVADRLPDVTLASLDGGAPVDLSRPEGAGGGEPVGELVRAVQARAAALPDFAKTYAGRSDVLGIDFQETQVSRPASWLAKTGVTYPLYADPDGQMRASGCRS